MSNKQWLNLIKGQFEKDPKSKMTVEYLLIDGRHSLRMDMEITLSTMHYFMDSINGSEKAFIEKAWIN